MGTMEAQSLLGKLCTFIPFPNSHVLVFLAKAIASGLVGKMLSRDSLTIVWRLDSGLHALYCAWSRGYIYVHLEHWDGPSLKQRGEGVLRAARVKAMGRP